jgi:hypothetical protein
MIRATYKALSLVLGAAALGACGGSGTQTAGIDRGGVATPVSVVGPITGFGSIVVNGVHYAVDKASVVVDGDPGGVSDLELGQIVTVVGEPRAPRTRCCSKPTSAARSRRSTPRAPRSPCSITR